MTPGEYVRRTQPMVDDVYAEFRRIIDWRQTCHRTRRIVEVTARKRRARRKRKH